MNKDLIIFDGKELNIISDRITSRGLNLFLGDVDSIHMSEIYKLNKTLSKIKIDYMNRKINININFLKKIVEIFSKNIIKRISNARDIYINAEGAIHHNRLTALILICIGLIAKEKNKKVIVINFTSENMADKYLKEFNKFDFVIPREKKTYLYLKNYVNKKKLLPSYDFAWLYLYKEYKDYLMAWKPSNKSKYNILFTKGVKIENIDEYTKYDYLMLDSGDYRLKKYFIKTIDAEKLENSKDKNISKFLDMLLKYDLLLSGRHHTNIVAMFLGLPTIGLNSNTSKINATMHDILELTYNNIIPFTNINFIDFMEESIVEKIIINFEELKNILNKNLR